MNCPYCNQEMQIGKVTFSSLQAFAQMILSYTAAEDAGKRFFKRASKNKILLAGDEMDACYCAACDKVILSFDAGSSKKEKG